MQASRCLETASGCFSARILTADDDRDTADMTADLLRLDGHQVNAVYDGQQAIETARTFWPHVARLTALGRSATDALDCSRPLCIDRN